MENSHLLNKVFYNRREAEKRVHKTGNLYSINSLSDLILHNEDFQLAKKVLQEEKEILSGEEGLFRGLVYCLLSSRQRYTEQFKTYNSLLNQNMSTPQEIRNGNEKLDSIIKEGKLIYPNQKSSYIKELAQNWENLNPTISENIKDNIGTSRNQEVNLRKYICQEINGLGEKTSSLFLRMCGAEYLIPLDSWMVEMLYFHGYPCKMPRTKVNRQRWRTNIFSPKQTKQGLDGKKYLKAEEFALNLANKYNVPGYLLQLTFWTKHSTYQKEKN